MKSTKIIAGLGVVAALGMAVMPFGGAFAADEGNTGTGATAAGTAAPDSDDVTVQVMVDPTIAIRVAGTQNIYQWDASLNDGAGGWAVVPQTDQEGFEEGTTLEGNITATKMTNNATSNTMKHNVYVTTNSASGYTLAVKATGTGSEGAYVANDNDLRLWTNGTTRADRSASGEDMNYIPAYATPTALAKGTAGWGLKAANANYSTGIASDFAGTSDTFMGATGVDQTVFTSEAEAFDKDLTEITYGISTSATQVTGLYQGKLTYTATVQTD